MRTATLAEEVYALLFAAYPDLPPPDVVTSFSVQGCVGGFAEFTTTRVMDK